MAKKAANKGKRTTEKVAIRNKVRQMYVFLITLPSGKKYVDNTTNKTPKEKMYWHYMQCANGKETPFYDAIRKECGGCTDNLELRILDYGQSNVDQLARQWIQSYTEMWIERLGTDREDNGGLNC